MTIYDSIKQQLQESFCPSFLEVIDESYKHQGHPGVEQNAQETHFKITIVSEAFEKIPLLEQHKKVYQALRSITPKIHSISLETRPPAKRPPLENLES